ncbi:MAG: oligopeptide transporter, OPT family [Thermoplasmata archaeon]|nr:oligopeptide transporter, OPT family [Thermoplasmata archaeon]
MEQKPYVPPEKSLPEYTIKAFVLGIILSIIIGTASVYLWLYAAGAAVSASIPASIISLAFLRLLKDKNILESNMVQTAASVGESLAIGIILTLPALIILNYYTEFPYYIVTVVSVIGGLLGVLSAVILRRVFIVEEKLPYPEGRACAEVLIAGDKGRLHAKPVVYGGLFGGIYKLLGNSGLWARTVETAKMVGSGVFYIGSELSAALIGVGYIIGLNIAFFIFLGGAIAWFVAVPFFSDITGNPHGLKSAVDIAYATWSENITYMGASAMIVGGFWKIVKLRRSVIRKIKSSLEIARRKQTGKGILRTEEDLPINYIIVLSIAIAVPLFLFYLHIINSVVIAAVIVIVLLAIGFLVSSIAGYVVGLVGFSYNPITYIAIINLFFVAILLKTLGLSGIEGMSVAILVAAVIFIAAAIAGDTMQDLATGHLVGATPKKQQIFKIISIFFTALVMAPVLNLLIKVYGIRGTATAKANALPAPHAFFIARFTESIFKETFYWYEIYLPIIIGVAIAIVFITLDEILAIENSRFRIPIMAIAVGIYLPLSISIPIFIGGITRYLVNKAKGNNVKEISTDAGVLGAAGLIAGEAIMMTFFAVLVVTNKAPSIGFSSNILGILFLVGLLIWLYMVGKKRDE